MNARGLGGDEQPTYGPQQVRAQIEATYARGINEWILWDPKVTYTSGALEPIPKNKSKSKSKSKKN